MEKDQGTSRTRPMGAHRFEESLTTYAMMAAGAAVLLPDTVEAAVVSSGPVDIEIGPGESFLLDLNGDLIDDFEIINRITQLSDEPENPKKGRNAQVKDVQTIQVRTNPAGQTVNAVAGFGGFFAGDKIAGLVVPVPGGVDFKIPDDADSQEKFALRSRDPASPKFKDVTAADPLMYTDPGLKLLSKIQSKWQGPESTFLGFQFDILGETHFGFAEASISGDPVPKGPGKDLFGAAALTNPDGVTVTIHEFAFQDTPNAPISTPIPEPTSLSLLALGSAGVLAFAAYRRRRNEETTSA